MKPKKSVLFIILIMLVLPLVLSAPPVTQTSNTDLQIQYTQYDVIKLNTEHRFHCHVVNSTHIITNKSASCFLHVYNQTGYDLTTISQQMEFEAYNGIDFALTVNGSNFSSIGNYVYIITCNTTTQAGFVSGNFIVTRTGLELPASLEYIFFWIIFLTMLGLSCYVVIYSLGHFAKLDFDLKDLAVNFGLYFVGVGYYFLHKYYYDLKFIDDILNYFLTIGGFLFVLIPIMAFILSLFYGEYSKASRRIRLR